MVVEEVSPPLSLLQPINMKNDSINTDNEKRLERMPFGNFLNLKIKYPIFFLLKKDSSMVCTALMTAYLVDVLKLFRIQFVKLY